LPDGIALDGAGQPTRVAADVAALLPRGGQIGSLLGLTVELLAGVAGAGRGDAKGRGVFILAFDPAAAGESIDWQGRLSALKSDWTDGGGYWPRGGALAAGTMLDGDFAQRLETHLARMTGQAGC
jgi:(2R)-3-sulfolactate dehydrogenase (NADP+)